ncbi:MAG: ABC transporter ATP-binding protein [Bacteroidetes bacterium]|nr:ABC transporter ATP-binding protein [Bacteroidota bacterium]MDA1120843.1 ABC transporter ATP-binding protein [Bacteroidota bacterium]
MSIVIKIENLSKAYQLGQFSTGTLSRDIERWWALTRGKDDPFLKITEDNDRSVAGISDMVWSLRDINLSIEQGDRLGIIGRNGAGKSTLLKILSRVTSPTNGTIKLKGRIASLLEVGTGFHPELTGRENIFLNGAILGMRKYEVQRCFDEIVNFAAIERFIDTPVKRYSSGMYVRLAFSVAAHLESEVLIVDEVLAVGDAEFQKKCIGKMTDLGQGGGRTIIFVSHNMSSIRALCSSALYLKNGKVMEHGETDHIISSYLSDGSDSSTLDGTIPEYLSIHGTGEGRFTYLVPIGGDGEIKREFLFQEMLKVKFQFQAFQDINDVVICLYIVNMFGQIIIKDLGSTDFKPRLIEKGVHEIVVSIDETLLPGDYSFGLSASHFQSGSDIDFIDNFMRFKIRKESAEKGKDYPWATVQGYLQPRSNWKKIKLK